MQYTVKVYSYEKVSSTGNKFRVYNVQSEKQGLIPLRFTRDCTPPNFNRFELKFEGNKALDKKTGRPMMWASKIIEVKEISTNNDALFEI